MPHDEVFSDVPDFISLGLIHTDLLPCRRQARGSPCRRLARAAQNRQGPEQHALPRIRFQERHL